MNENKKELIYTLCDALILIENRQDMFIFLKDLCTPQELETLSERWRVCLLLNEGDMSYRDIHHATGASLTTITRVARFLKDEPNKGYQKLLKRMKEND